MQNSIYIEKILEKYSDMVYRIALARVGTIENAEDIYQDVFTKFSQKLPKFESEEHEKAWFIRVTINMSKNLVNKFFNRKEEKLDENLLYVDNDEIDTFSIISNLPANYKTVLYLKYYEDYKVKEIAKFMRVNENTVKTWLSRSRELLKDRLKGGFDDE